MYVAVLIALLALCRAAVIRRDDSFFTPDEGWEDKKPGDILRWRSIEAKFLEQDFKVAEAYQVLYRTTHNRAEEASHTVTTILVPYNAKKDALVVGSAAQDANAQQCTPSASLTYNSGHNAVFMVDEYNFMQFMREGYVMTIPDKEGPRNAFAAGLMEGHMLLDGIRAALNFGKIGLEKDARVAVFGYSGGAITAGWAAQLKGAYADEVNVVGWALGGTPVDLKSTIDKVDGTAFSGLVVGGVTGILDAYPDIKRNFSKHITRAGEEAMEFAHHNCVAEVLLKYPFKSIYSKEFQTIGEGVFRSEGLRQMFEETHMGRKREVPDAPVYMYHGKHDEIIPYGPARETAEQWCDNGGRVYFQTYTHIEHGHIVTEITGGEPAFRFLKDRLEGKEYEGGCKFEEKGTLVFDAHALGSSAKRILRMLLTVLGKHVGEAKVLRGALRERERRSGGSGG